MSISDFRKYKCDPREGRRSRQKLQTHAETVKHVLSTMDTAKCYIESLHEGIDFNMNVSRARFENEVSKALPELMAPVREALEASGLAADAVEKVVLVGGSAKIPRIQKAVGDIFDSAEVLASISADEVIAVGAATQASIMEEKILAFAEEKAIDVKGSSNSTPLLRTNLLALLCSHERNDFVRRRVEGVLRARAPRADPAVLSCSHQKVGYGGGRGGGG